MQALVRGDSQLFELRHHGHEGVDLAELGEADLDLGGSDIGGFADDAVEGFECGALGGLQSVEDRVGFASEAEVQ